MSPNDAPTTNIQRTTGTSTNGVHYRAMRWEDLDDVTACFDRVWPQREGIAGTPLALLIARYLTLHYVEQGTWANIAELGDGTFAGITLVRVEGHPTLFPQAHDALEETRALINADPRGAQMLDMFEHGFFVREDILEEDSDVRADTQAELELFMVNPDVRGHGVGRALWEDLLGALRAMGVRAFFLHTDSSCDYGFYDHKGLVRVAERIAADHPEDADLTEGLNTDDQYIYRADLNNTALTGALNPAQDEVRGA
ncbi:GNAT family N-acetyltransferase [Bifidobacterium criceti]|uniref:Acetyltransferase, GNAT family n=1 Tax=Bifidobacterium criceti TaxID=1960969 RepID=A0A2A2EJ25_9BIFI|nr:GNAT family N-acetyltransferase [Bifidobacterium criceti]PAU68925.1 acetyltransferase, GNAT family [Bifidobacterium criceti]